MIIFNSYVSHYQRVPCFFGGFLLGCEDPELHPEQQIGLNYISMEGSKFSVSKQTLVEECLQTLVFQNDW